MNKIISIAALLMFLVSCQKIGQDDISTESITNITFVSDEETKGTGINETSIYDISFFQFNNVTGRLINAKYISYDNPIYTNANVSVINTPNIDYDLYFIINGGDQTKKYTIGQTQKSTVDTSSFAVPPGGVFSSIPMSGKYSGNTIPNSITVSITRAVAKISFTVDRIILQTDTSKLGLGEIYLRSVPSRGNFFTTEELWPDENANYIDYPKQNIEYGDTIVWHLPENKRGTVETITAEEDKNINNMPSPHCTRVVLSLGYQHQNLFDIAEADVIIGINHKTDFNLVRNRHYYYNTTISDLADPRIRWTSIGNKITYIENDGVVKDGIFYGKGVWAPANLGSDTENPKGIYYLWGNDTANNVNETTWNLSTIENISIRSPLDPCPRGWRVPSSLDFSFIFLGDYGSSLSPYQSTWEDGLKYSSGYPPSSTLFFPVAGILSEGTMDKEDEGYYWTNRYSRGRVYYLYFTKYSAGTTCPVSNRIFSLPVRCIFDNTDYLRYYYPL